MASKTQFRLAQLTGSLGSSTGQINQATAASSVATIDADDISVPQQDYIQQVISDFETSLFEQDTDYHDMIDMGSFVDFMIIQEISLK